MNVPIFDVLEDTAICETSEKRRRDGVYHPKHKA